MAHLPIDFAPPGSAKFKRSKYTVRKKTSGIRVKLGESPEKWEQEAYTELVRQHPWVTKFTVRPKMTASSSEGYAAGYFQIIPKDVPASAQGAKSMNVLAVPLIIKNRELYPFDVYSHGGQFFPLTKERALRLLSLRDIFKKTDRTQFGSRLNRGTTTNISGSWSKMSAADTVISWATELNEFLNSEEISRESVESLASLRKESTAGYHKEIEGIVGSKYIMIDARIPHETVKVSHVADYTAKSSNLLLDAADACAVEFKYSHISGASARVHFRSHPLSGDIGVGEWGGVPIQDLSKRFGNGLVETLMKTSAAVYSLNEATFDEGDALVNTYTAIQKLSFFEKAKRSKSNNTTHHLPAALHQFVYKGPPTTFKRESVESPEKLPHEFKGYPILSPLGHELAGVLLETGRAFHMPNYYELQNYVHVITPSVKALPTVIEGISSAFGQVDESISLAVWREDKYLMGVSFVSEGFNLDGAIYHKTDDFKYEYPSILVTTGGEFKRSVLETVHDQDVLHIPVHAEIIQIQSNLHTSEKLHNEPSLAAPDETLMDVAKGAEKVSVRFDGRYAIYNDTFDAVDKPSEYLNRGNAKIILSQLGASEHFAESLLKASEDTGHVNTYMFPKNLAEGKKVLSSVNSSANSLGAIITPLWNSMPRFNLPKVLPTLLELTPATKFSSSAVSTSVDSALSLGFLTRKNLLRFVNLLPALEEAQNAVSTLVVASRLGLDEVSEVELISVMESMEPILRGLRTIQAALIS